MKRSKKINSTLQRKINLINERIPKINGVHRLPLTYAGANRTYYIEVFNIEVKNQFVYIKTNKDNNMLFEKRYCVNDKYQLRELKSALIFIDIALEINY